MDKIVIALGKGATDAAKIAQLSLKVKQTIKRLEKWPKLSDFLQDFFSRPEMQLPADDQVEYLNTLFDQVLELFPPEFLAGIPADKPEKLEVPLFQLFVRYNFNHERVFRFYLSEIHDLASINKDRAEETLSMIRVHCEVTPRKDMAFNKAGNTLGEDLLAEIDRHFNLMNFAHAYFRPIDVAVRANVFIPFLSLMIAAGLIKKPFGSEKFYQSVSKTFRGPDGNAFAIGTIRNQFGITDGSKLEELMEVINEMKDELEHKMKIKAKKERGGLMN